MHSFAKTRVNTARAYRLMRTFSEESRPNRMRSCELAGFHARAVSSKLKYRYDIRVVAHTALQQASLPLLRLASHLSSHSKVDLQSPFTGTGYEKSESCEQIHP